MQTTEVDSNSSSARTGMLFGNLCVAFADIMETPNMIVPVTEVDSTILAKVVEFCKFHHLHQSSPQAAEAKRHWDKEFTNIDKSTLFSLIMVSLRQSPFVCALKQLVVGEQKIANHFAFSY